MENKISVKSFTHLDGKEIEIKYWAEEDNICLAGFNSSGQMVTSITRTAAAGADDWLATLGGEVIQQIADQIISDIRENPELNYSP